MNPDSPLSRRSLLASLTALLGASTLAPGILAAVTQPEASPNNRLLSRYHRKILRLCCDLIIPETDTAGAVSAQVPEFIEHVLVNYYSEKHALTFLRGLEQLSSMSSDRISATDPLSDRFIQASSEQQQQWLETIDTQALVEKQQTAFHQSYRDLKGLVILGYYTSEIGATQELQWDPVPGAYHGSVPYEDVGSASSSTRS